MKYNKSDIGARIARQRKLKGITQERLAEATGISKNQMSSIERGISSFKIEFLFKICDELGETPDFYLIGTHSEIVDELTELLASLKPYQQKFIRDMLKSYTNK